MRIHIQALEAEAEADALALGPAVLLNDLLFAQLWGHMDADDRKRLRTGGGPECSVPNLSRTSAAGLQELQLDYKTRAQS
ncbi:hypothetical protein FOA52_008525 [Chlamydomonas sp. UWO 241]|nr:hypothetical protein FOA52_008525 [Chlamydomonas sp. UWO 241]